MRASSVTRVEYLMRWRSTTPLRRAFAPSGPDAPTPPASGRAPRRRHEVLGFYGAVSRADVRWRVAMLRLLTIFAMFLVAGTGPVKAQHQEADLQRVAIPGAGFDLVVATPKSVNIIHGMDGTADAIVILLNGGAMELALVNVQSIM